MTITYLIVPGYTSSGPAHWQTLWESAYEDCVRVQQRSWDAPQCDEWVDALHDHVVRFYDVVLIAHSLGCATVAHWCRAHGAANVRGAFLVAPADVDRPDLPREISGFRPMPLERLPFPSIVVASEDDPYVSIDRARQFASAWGSRFANVGREGHINTASGRGPWPEGAVLLRRFVQSIGADVPRTRSRL